MPQHDQNIANQGYPATRADINAALVALFSNSSGSTAPSTTAAGQFWLDTSATPNTMRIRNRDNSAWLPLFELDTGITQLALTAGGVDVKSAAPTLRLTQTDGPTNEKIYELGNDQSSGNLQLRSLTDAGVAGATGLEVQRTGTAFDAFLFNSPVFGQLGYLAATGTANTYAVTLPIFGSNPTLPDGFMLCVRINVANTGASTLSVNTGTARAIVKNASVALVAGDLPATVPAVVVWDATNTRWQLVGLAASIGSATTSAAGIVELATDAETANGSDTGRVAPVSSLIKHKGVAKAYARISKTGSVTASYGCSSVTRNSAGNYTYNFSTAFASTDFIGVGAISDSSGCTGATRTLTKTTTSCNMQVIGTCDSGYGNFDWDIEAVFYGDQ